MRISYCSTDVCSSDLIEVVETDVLHDVVALGVRQGVVCLAKVPLAGEIGVVTGLLQDRCQGPLGSRQTAALTLEGDRRHAAAVRDAAGLDGGAAGRAAWLRIE